MTLLQSIILALIQGFTELFPVSSVAHGVLTPYVLGWNLDPEFLNEHFLPFLVMLHLGTAVALLLFFGSEWLQILASLFRRDLRTRRLLILLIVGTVPAALIGLIFEKSLRHLFSNVSSAAFFLIINGLLLYWGERQRHSGQKEIEELSLGEAALIGLFQSLALVPGFSRSGATITAGFWMGLRHEASARFSMLLATPVIAGAGILEIPKLVHSGTAGLLQTALAGGVAAGIAAYISVWFLMRWFHVNEISAMKPFAWYCVLAGAGVLAFRSLF